MDIDNTIIEPSGQYIVNDCYNSLTGASAFCSRITRDFSDPTDPVITILDNGFLNRDNEKARGLDVNVTFSDQIVIAEKPFELDLDITAHRSIERSTLFIDDEGNRDFENYAEEWGFPSWKANSTLRVRWDNWRVQLRSNFIAAVDQDPAGIDPFSDIFDSNGTGTTGDTCLGGQQDLLCRDVGFAKDYLVHSLSLNYSEDNWSATVGASNLFDKAPPQVDGSEISSKNNAAIGYGYNMMGRTIYANFGYKF